MSFLYVEMCSVSQDDNGTKLTTGGQDGHQSTYIPSATIAAIILGPGTSITQPAVVALGRAGCSVSFAGSGAVRSYGTFLSPNSPTRLLTRQAEVVSDPAQRAVAARVMFSKRFPDNGMISRSTEQMNLEALRGLEGVRMKETYRLLARRHRLSGWRRNSGTDPSMGEPDPVNLALNYANTALYGVTHCVVGLLGLSPGLGILHTGNRASFVLDIADLYKTDVTIPLAFAAGSASDPSIEVLRQLRRRFRLLRLMPRIVDDIHEVLGVDTPSTGGDDWSANDVYLWGESGAEVLSRAGRV